VAAAIMRWRSMFCAIGEDDVDEDRLFVFFWKYPAEASTNMSGTISRRCVVGLLGAVGATGVLSVGAPAMGQGAALVDPIAVGSRFGRWKVVAIHPVEEGALRVDVSGEDGHVFAIEILARDPSPMTAQPPAVTEGLALYVRNGGDGWSPTVEEQGLAAMALAQLLASQGKGAAITGLLTHGERVVAHGPTLLGEDPRMLRWRAIPRTD
jgi:hypothetical protein